jgi:hypothetical protein
MTRPRKNYFPSMGRRVVKAGSPGRIVLEEVENKVELGLIFSPAFDHGF